MVLLEPERIGVELSEELQLHPEQSTDFFVLHTPGSKVFQCLSRRREHQTRGPLRSRAASSTQSTVSPQVA